MQSKRNVVNGRIRRIEKIRWILRSGDSSDEDKERSMQKTQKTDEVQPTAGACLAPANSSQEDRTCEVAANDNKEAVNVEEKIVDVSQPSQEEFVDKTQSLPKSANDTLTAAVDRLMLKDEEEASANVDIPPLTTVPIHIRRANSDEIRRRQRVMFDSDDSDDTAHCESRPKDALCVQNELKNDHPKSKGARMAKLVGPDSDDESPLRQKPVRRKSTNSSDKLHSVNTKDPNSTVRSSDLMRRPASTGRGLGDFTSLRTPASANPFHMTSKSGWENDRRGQSAAQEPRTILVNTRVPRHPASSSDANGVNATKPIRSFQISPSKYDQNQQQSVTQSVPTRASASSPPRSFAQPLNATEKTKPTKLSPRPVFVGTNPDRARIVASHPHQNKPSPSPGSTTSIPSTGKDAPHHSGKSFDFSVSNTRSPSNPAATPHARQQEPEIRVRTHGPVSGNVPRHLKESPENKGVAGKHNSSHLPPAAVSAGRRDSRISTRILSVLDSDEEAQPERPHDASDDSDDDSDPFAPPPPPTATAPTALKSASPRARRIDSDGRRPVPAATPAAPAAAAAAATAAAAAGARAEENTPHKYITTPKYHTGAWSTAARLALAAEDDDPARSRRAGCGGSAGTGPVPRVLRWSVSSAGSALEPPPPAHSATAFGGGGRRRSCASAAGAAGFIERRTRELLDSDEEEEIPPPAAPGPVPVAGRGAVDRQVEPARAAREAAAATTAEGRRRASPMPRGGRLLR